MARDAASALDNDVSRLAHDDARHTHGTGRVRAAALLHHIGVAVDEPDLSERHAEPVRDALCEAGLVPLSARCGADHHVNGTLGEYRDFRAFDRKAAGHFD